MKVTVIGTGFVGVVSACVYAHLGHEVSGLDIDQNKIEKLKKGQVPFFEPGLEELLKETQASGRLKFTTDYAQAIPKSQVIIIAVGTPSTPEGGVDLSYVQAAVKSLAPHLSQGAIVAIKSTVPPGTFEKIEPVLSDGTKVEYHLASLPEFLREGKAVDDTLHPDRIVIGARSDHAFRILEKLNQSLSAPVIKVRPESAQMGKYASNAYLATRITFINQIADLCEKNGADVDEVTQIMGKDKRIGEHYWYPGFGYGGSCFPKDVNELAAYSRSIGETGNLLVTIHELNQARIPKLMAKFEDQVGGWKGKRVAVLGLSFKPFTNDMRESPSIGVIKSLLTAQAQVRAYDPKAIEVADYFIPAHPKLEYISDIGDACRDADVIMVMIEWPEIIEFDFSQVRIADKTQWLIDARNQLSGQKLTKQGFKYLAIGKPTLE